MVSILSKLPTRKTLKAFIKARTGSVALMTGLTFPLLFVAAGGAADYTNAVRTKQIAQRAMDAAVLALANKDISGSDLQAEGKKIFEAILEERGLKKEAGSSRFVEEGEGVRGTASMRNPTRFLGFIGLDTIESEVQSTAVPPIALPIEMSLVLDVSGSMSSDLNGQERIARMKAAVNGMLTKLENDLPISAKVSVALVPYSSSVNITGLSGVVAPTSVAGSPAPVSGESIWAAERSIAASGTTFTLDDASATVRPIPFVLAGEMDAAEPSVRVRPLSTSLASIRGAVNGLSPAGWTAGHIGMAWGVYTLSNRWSGIWPTAPRPYGSAEKVIVLLSDGEFNNTHNIGARSSSDDVTSYAYFDAVCDFAAANDIIIYAVALNLDAASQTKLGNCVANGGKLYPADTASGLSDAFQDIANRIGRTRLTS